GLGGAAAGRAGRPDCLGAGRHLPRHPAVLRAGVAAGQLAAPPSPGSRQGLAVCKGDAAGQHERLCAGDRGGVRAQ
nr:hypothetical protein [Tanacetum cinerariifolium]